MLHILSSINFAKTIHLRHANREASLQTRTLKNRNEIIRNTYEPYDFYLDLNGKKTNLRTAGIGIRFEQRIVEMGNPDIEVGKIKYNYADDWSIDYEYNQGEVFRYEDCIDGNQRLRIQEVYQECCDYFDALVDLFEAV